MEKQNKNTKLTFTLDKELGKIFEKYINENLLSKSKVIENLILEYMKDKK